MKGIIKNVKPTVNGGKEMYLLELDVMCDKDEYLKLLSNSKNQQIDL